MFHLRRHSLSRFEYVHGQECAGTPREQGVGGMVFYSGPQKASNTQEKQLPSLLLHTSQPVWEIPTQPCPGLVLSKDSQTELDDNYSEG